MASRTVKLTVAVSSGADSGLESRRLLLPLSVAFVGWAEDVLNVSRAPLPFFPFRPESSSVRDPTRVSSFCWLILLRRRAGNVSSLDLDAGNFDRGISSESPVESSGYVRHGKRRLSTITYI